VAALPVEVVARVGPPAWAEARASAAARAWAAEARLVRSVAWLPPASVVAVVASRAWRQVWQTAAEVAPSSPVPLSPALPA
jgi:hypothetical protein